MLDFIPELDWQVEQIAAIALASVGLLLLLVSWIWERRRQPQAPSRLPGGDFVEGRAPPRSALFATIEFLAPVVAPPAIWITLRAMTGAAAVPAIAGLVAFVFARRTVRWVADLPSTLRTGRIDRGLEDMLEMMLLCVEAGLGVDQMLERVERSLVALHPELGAEIARLRHGVTLLPNRSDGYRAVAATTSSDAFRSMLGVFERAERTGTPLGPTLRLLMDDLVVRRERKAEGVAQRLPVYLVVVLVLLFMPAVLLILIGPYYIRLIEVLRAVGRTPWSP